MSGKGEDEFKQLVKDIHSKTLSERKSREWENFTYNHCLLFDHNTDNSTIITQQRQRLINAVKNTSWEAAIPGTTQQSVNNVVFGSSVVVIVMIALLAVGFGLRGSILNKICKFCGLFGYLYDRKIKWDGLSQKYTNLLYKTC